MTDPSWFYSSLPQVSASIVGLIGALIGSHFLENLVFIRKKRTEFDKIAYNSYKRLKGRFYQFSEMEKSLGELLKITNTTIESKGTSMSIPETRHRLTENVISSRASSIDGFDNIKIYKEDLDKELALLAKLKEAYPEIKGYIKADYLLNCAGNIKQCKDMTISWHPKDKDLAPYIDADIKDLEDFTFELKDLQTRSIPGLPLILFIAGFSIIILIGIIWPLFVLPGLYLWWNSKNLMLWGVGIGLIILDGYYFFLIKDIIIYGNPKWPEK